MTALTQLLLTLWLGSSAHAEQPAAPAKRYTSHPVDTAHGDREHFLLWPSGAPGAVGEALEDRPKLTVYRAARDKANGAAVVICPGGGYVRLASDHEGKQVAEWLNSLGVTAFVLQYRVGPRYRYPAPVHDAQRALRSVRARAASFDIDPGRVGILGFSAGGHLSAFVATLAEAGQPQASDPVERQSARPDFAVLAYPVVTFTAAYAHAGSVTSLTGGSTDPALREALSPELHVTPNAPPVFMFHTADDPTVPVENSTTLFLALRKASVRAELHVFAHGGHGVGLAPGDPDLGQWPGLCAAWLRSIGVLTPWPSGDRKGGDEPRPYITACRRGARPPAIRVGA